MKSRGKYDKAQHDVISWRVLRVIDRWMDGWRDHNRATPAPCQDFYLSLIVCSEALLVLMSQEWLMNSHYLRKQSHQILEVIRRLQAAIHCTTIAGTEKLPLPSPPLISLHCGARFLSYFLLSWREYIMRWMTMLPVNHERDNNKSILRYLMINIVFIKVDVFNH